MCLLPLLFLLFLISSILISIDIAYDNKTFLFSRAISMLFILTSAPGIIYSIINIGVGGFIEGIEELYDELSINSIVYICLLISLLISYFIYIILKQLIVVVRRIRGRTIRFTVTLASIILFTFLNPLVFAALAFVKGLLKYYEMNFLHSHLTGLVMFFYVENFFFLNIALAFKVMKEKREQKKINKLKELYQNYEDKESSKDK